MAVVRRGYSAGAALRDGAHQTYPRQTPEMQAGIDAVLSDARHSLSMRAKLLEQRLEGRDFLVAGRMTLADISVGYPLNNMGKPDFASLLGPRATAYRERLLARPAFQRAAAVP